MSEKICPKCGMKMLKRYNYWASSTPRYWWCGCGYTEEGGLEVRMGELQLVREKWERLNNIGGFVKQVVP